MLSPLGVFAACGQVLEDTPPRGLVDASASNEAATDGAPGSDVFVDAGSCDPTKPFGTPVRLKGIPFGASCMRLSQDEQLAFYTIDFDSYVATRTADGFVQTSLLAVEPSLMPSGGSAICPTFSADRTMLFHEIDFAVWRQTGVPGGRYAKKTQVQARYADGGAFMSSYLGIPYFDEPRHELYVTVGYLGAEFGNRWNIAVAPVTDAGAVGGFRILDLLTDRDQRPVISADGLSLYFESLGADAASDASDAETDVHVARRSTLSDPFGPATKVPNVNGPGRDRPTWISPDDCRLYIASWRERPVYGDPSEMFVATRGR